MFQLLIINISITLQDCARPLSIEADENGCYPLDGKILCMKCHTQRAKQAAHWLAKAASLSVTMNQIQKHRIHPAADFFCLCDRALFSICAQVCGWMFSVNMYVCMQIKCSISFVFVHFIQCRGNVLHRNWFYSTSPILQSPISPSLLLEPFFGGGVPIVCLR